jgi:hypothetical protein
MLSHDVTASSKRMIARFVAYSTDTSVTPSTPSIALLTGIGQRAQVMFATASVTVRSPATATGEVNISSAIPISGLFIALAFREQTGAVVRGERQRDQRCAKPEDTFDPKHTLDETAHPGTGTSAGRAVRGRTPVDEPKTGAEACDRNAEEQRLIRSKKPSDCQSMRR